MASFLTRWSTASHPQGSSSTLSAQDANHKATAPEPFTQAQAQSQNIDETSKMSSPIMMTSDQLLSITSLLIRTLDAHQHLEQKIDMELRSIREEMNGLKDMMKCQVDRIVSTLETGLRRDSNQNTQRTFEAQETSGPRRELEIPSPSPTSDDRSSIPNEPPVVDEDFDQLMGLLANDVADNQDTGDIEPMPTQLYWCREPEREGINPNLLRQPDPRPNARAGPSSSQTVIDTPRSP